MPKNRPQPQKNTNEKKDYAKFSMQLTWTYLAGRQKGKPKQTFRDDLTILSFENNGVKVSHLHPIEVLHRKFLLEKPATYSVVIYDNSVPRAANQIVFRQIIQGGKIMQYEDRRADYFDLQTGIAHPKSPFQLELEKQAANENTDGQTNP